MMVMRQERGVVELHVYCHYKCTMWILNQVKLLRCWASRYITSLLIHPCMYPLCCPLPLCIHGNSCLLGPTTGNLQCLKRIHLIMFIVGNIRQCLSFVDQWEWGFKLYCILVVLEWGSSSEVYILFYSYWLNHTIQLWCWYSCQLRYVLWQFWLLSLWYLEPYWHFTAQQCLITVMDWYVFLLCCLWVC
jgi:hypothetical protein